MLGSSRPGRVCSPRGPLALPRSLHSALGEHNPGHRVREPCQPPSCLPQDLFSALIKGPTRTPYEDGLYLFDIQLPNIYPAVPPHFCYLSQCSGRLNPNLYDNGKVCVSLLGTWIGKVSTVRRPLGTGASQGRASGQR